MLYTPDIVVIAFGVSYSVAHEKVAMSDKNTANCHHNNVTLDMQALVCV